MKREIFAVLPIGLLVSLLLLAACGEQKITPTVKQAVEPTASIAPSATPVPSPIPLPSESSTTTMTPQTFTKRIIGYYTSWSIYARDYQVLDIPGEQLSHINYAFANIDNDIGECLLGDTQADGGNFAQFLVLKERFPHLKVFISIGGWTWSGKFSDVALTEASRNIFVESCINLFLKGSYEGIFDGIDIDWEYPVGGGLSDNVTRPEDKHNYTLLMETFRSQLDELGEQTGREYLLTIAAPASPNNYSNYELQALARHLDWINVMTYDYHGGWDMETNFNAPLYATKLDPTGGGLNIDATIQGYLDAGVPAEQIVLGVPFYGRGWAGVLDVEKGLYQDAMYLPEGTWEKGVFDYKDLAANYVNQGDFVRYWHAEVKVPWLYSPSQGIFITYDDPQTMRVKAEYINMLGLGGVMFWELSADDGSLLGTLNEHLNP
jgi:chitinase